MACVSGAVYLRWDNGQIAWFARRGAARHRRAILVDGDLPPLSKGERFYVEDRHILFNQPGGLRCLVHASVHPSGPAIRTSPFNANKAIKQHAELLHSRLEDGFGFWIGILAGDFRPGQAAGHLVSLVQPQLVDLMQRTRQADIEGLLTVSADLVGLGPGLTPSGDDFLGGLLYAFQLVRRHPLQHQNFKQDLELWIDQIKPKTNEISHTLLADHARGYAALPFEIWFAELGQGLPDEMLAALAGEATGIGHSTGVDLVAGALTAIAAIDPTFTIPRSDR